MFQRVSGAQYVKLPLSKSMLKKTPERYKTFTPYSGPQPIFEAFMTVKDIPGNFVLDHFLLHAGNKCVLPSDRKGTGPGDGLCR